MANHNDVIDPTFTPEIVRDETRACDLVDAILNRQKWSDPYNDRATEKLRAARDLALLVGGPALRSFVRCVETLDRFEATIYTDSCPFSLTWQGRGLFGGMIFHPRRDPVEPVNVSEWSIHT